MGAVVGPALHAVRLSVLILMAYCTSCAKELDDAARFCLHCGAPTGVRVPPRPFPKKLALAAGLIVILVLVVLALVNFWPYLQPTPNVIGEWSGSPSNAPAAAQYLGNGLVQLTIANVGAGGTLSGTMSIAGVYSEPISGNITGRHITVDANFSNLSFAGGYLTLNVSGIVNGDTIDGKLIENVHAGPVTLPVSSAIALSRVGVSQGAATPQQAAMPVTPVHISSVLFTGAAGNYSIEIDGSGFGSPPFTLPYSGVSGYFKLDDDAAGAEIGYLGDADALNFVSWTDSRIQITNDTYQAPGDSFIVGVWNPQTQQGAVYGGNIPPVPAGTPQISSVAFSGSGQSLHVTINGSGFGPPPPGVPSSAGGQPLSGDTNNLAVSDWAYHDFSGGGGGGAKFTAGNSGNSTGLVYQSWTDGQIQIGGFSGTYGAGGMIVKSGDPLEILVRSTSSERFTAWGGVAP